MSEEAVAKLTVAAAALAAGQPQRSLFRAVEKGVVASTKRDGVTVVDPADVAAWAERRAARRQAAEPAPLQGPAASLPPTGNPGLPPIANVMHGSPPSAPATSPAGSGRPAQGGLDGDQFAVLVGAFERGETPIDLAQTHRLASQVVAAAYRQYLDLKSLSAGRTTLTERLERIDARLDDLGTTLDALMTGGWTAPMLELQRDLTELRGQVIGLCQQR